MNCKVLTLTITILLLSSCYTPMNSSPISPLIYIEDTAQKSVRALQTEGVIRVNSAGQTIDSEDGKCTLPEAILSANQERWNRATLLGECAIGQGKDTIIFDGVSTVTLTAAYSLATSYHGPLGLPPIASTIIISGGIQGITIERPPENIKPYRILRISGPNGRLTLENVTIQGGSTEGIKSGAEIPRSGGGILLHNQAALTLTNQSLITGARGGGIYGIYETRVTLIDSMVSNGTGSGISARDQSHIILLRSRIKNMVAKSGGGLDARDNSTIELVDSTISHNTAKNGGGIYVNHASNITLNNSDIISNTIRSGLGAGILLDRAISPKRELPSRGYTTIRKSRITHNRCEANPSPDGFPIGRGGSGGGISAHTKDEILIVDSDISHNGCLFGGISAGSGTLTIQNSQISHNRSYALLVPTALYARVVDTHIHNNQGGGIDNLGKLEVINSHIFSNTGPGIFADSGEIIVYNSSIVGNKNERGGGGGVHLEGPVVAQFINSRISSNTAQAYFTDYNASGGLSARSAFVTIKNSELSHNHAFKNEEEPTVEAQGGAISAVYSNIKVNYSYIAHNSAAGQGGGIFVGKGGNVTLRESQLVQNQAHEGGALQNMGGRVIMSNNVIMDNSHTAITGTGSITATHNWWGQSDGPSGAGPGSGDSVGASVDFSSFYTQPTIDDMKFACEAKPIFLPWVEQ